MPCIYGAFSDYETLRLFTCEIMTYPYGSAPCNDHHTLRAFPGVTQIMDSETGGLSEYELQRLERIKENRKMLDEVGGWGWAKKAF